MYTPLQSQTIPNLHEPVRNPILDQMKAIADERGKYEVTLLNEFPSLYSIHEFIFLGSFSWVSQANKWKFILAKHAINTESGWTTPASIARDYIQAKYGRPGRISSNQYHEIMRHRQAPLYAVPGVYEEAVYLDLKSAYWSILQVLGWDVDYYPGRWISRKSDVRDFPYYKHKLARNCLVSVGLSGQSKAWNGEKLIFHRKQNRFTNMMLWSAVQDVLHAIAEDMVRVGAVYVHTDGYIVPKSSERAAMQVFDEWGLIGTERHRGTHEVITAGTYAAPGKPNNRIQKMRPRYFNGVKPVFSAWLKERFAKFSHSIDLILA